MTSPSDVSHLSDNSSVLTREQRIHFRDELRAARAAVLRDAENFDAVLFAIERFGQFLQKKRAGLGTYRDAFARHLFSAGAEMHRSRFDRMFNHVREGRNSALHVGAAARHLARSCVSLALMLEDQLAKEFSMVSDFMVPNPVCAAAWQQLSAIRQTMLSSSFSYLPAVLDKRIVIVSDAALVRYLRSAGGKSTDERLAHSLAAAAAADLDVPEAVTGQEDEPVESILERMRPPEPVVILGKGGEIVGILTPFDLL